MRQRRIQNLVQSLRCNCLGKSEKFFEFVISILTLSENFKFHLYILGILYIILCCKYVVITTFKKIQNKNTKFNTQN